MTQFSPGISVIIPTYEANEALTSALESLARQTINLQLLEVIVVVNGPRALTARIVEPAGLNIRVFRCLEAGAGRARNIGIAAARREYITLLDDDDALEENFLSTAWSLTAPSTCVLLPIVDVKAGDRNEHNPLNARIHLLAGQSVPAYTAPWAFGFNACKVFPTSLGQQALYPMQLRSGEDVAFFGQIMANPKLVLRVPSVGGGQAYLRTIRPDSVSRKEMSFDFNVMQRLECIAELRKIHASGPTLQALGTLENAQFSFIRKYLDKRPSEIGRAIESAVKLRIPGLPWIDLRKDRVRLAVYSYCFPPYADTSANVVAKYIRQRGELVDVFYGNMDRVRGKDDSTQLIIEPYVAYSYQSQTQPSFSDWNLICEYARKAFRASQKRQRTNGRYSEIYSRALWSGSHVAALLHKNKDPKIFWEAEFSDPLAVGIDGRLRQGKLTFNKVTRLLRSMIKREGFGQLEATTHFELTELATLISADRLVFTNANQQKVMLERYPAELQKLAHEKSIIRHHPVPTPAMYCMAESDYSMPADRINLGYFGNFYKERGIGEVAVALSRLDSDEAERVTLHVFTSRPEEVRASYHDLIGRGLMKVNGYVPYLEFLSLTRRCDVLVVQDTQVHESAFSANPFLPSKYADYIGSGAPVWGLVSPHSPLSKLSLHYRSELGDPAQASEVLRKILATTK